MFDRVEIRVRSGSGGNGAISFRREKFVPFGGPDGGDGGNGGSVVVRSDDSVDSLRKFRQKRLYRAENGRNGGGNKKHGRNGGNLILTVPAGTLISHKMAIGDDAFIADLEQPGAEAVVAVGGRGGWGNARFASSVNQAPQIAQRGEPGEEQEILLEMRLIADVGIIGYPNVGKSTLLAAASAARPKIDSYPFTTIEPVLGVVEVGQASFVMAEIPGLIEDAHLGRGLGHDFLRHILRTKILIHLLSGSSASPVEDMMRVNEELALFDSALARKPQVIAVNKIDLPEVSSRLAGIRDDLSGAGIRAYYISAATGQGVSELMAEAMKELKAIATEEKSVRLTKKIFRPPPKDAGVGVSKVGDEYILTVPALERIVLGAGVSPSELRWHLKGQLDRLGVNKALIKAGVKPGDKIRCGKFEWEW
jgi:GTP-binding protein